MTINDHRTNVSFLDKSTEANSSRSKKDEEVGSSRKIQGKKAKDPMVDLDGKAPDFGGIIRESLSICPIYNKWGLRDGNDSEYDSVANFIHGGHKMRGTITPTNIGMSPEDDFFDDTESCSSEPANLDEVTLFYLLSPFSFIRDDIEGLVFHPSPIFFVLDWCVRLGGRGYTCC